MAGKDDETQSAGGGDLGAVAVELACLTLVDAALSLCLALKAANDADARAVLRDRAKTVEAVGKAVSVAARVHLGGARRPARPRPGGADPMTDEPGDPHGALRFAHVSLRELKDRLAERIVQNARHFHCADVDGVPGPGGRDSFADYLGLRCGSRAAPDP